MAASELLNIIVPRIMGGTTPIRPYNRRSEIGYGRPWSDMNYRAMQQVTSTIRAKGRIFIYIDGNGMYKRDKKTINVIHGSMAIYVMIF